MTFSADFSTEKTNPILSAVARLSFVAQRAKKEAKADKPNFG